MKKDIHDLKKVVADILQKDSESIKIGETNRQLLKQLDEDIQEYSLKDNGVSMHEEYEDPYDEPIQESEVIEESLSLQKKEIDLIRKALEKHNGKRKNAARDLGISERTLYRKIKEYDIG
jgi:transcriptional regulator with PAS, ATPase and Fis domain